MSTVFTTTNAAALKETLSDILTDNTDKLEESLHMKKWLKQKSMDDAWVEDQEYAGPGLLSEKPEGQDIATGTMRQGFAKRYIARTYALQMIVTDEALEDNKYDEVIQAGKRMKKSAFWTINYDSATIPARAWNSSYVGGDGVSLANASHPLAHGGTFSNTLATAMSPSRLALQTVMTAVEQLPSHNGLFDPLMVKKILCPVGQRFTWEGILGSKNVPESNNNEINVVAKADIDLVPIVYWSDSTTRWGVTTDADNGLQWRWRRRMRSTQWVENSNMTMKYAISYRADWGWSNPRSFYGSNA